MGRIFKPSKKPTKVSEPSTSRDLVLVTRAKYPLPAVKTKPKPHKITKVSDDKETAKANQSLFKKKLKRIRRLAKEEGYDEKHKAMVLRGLLDTVLDLIPLAEENYRRYRIDRSAYALNTYFNQVREIQNDLRAIEDFQERSDKIKQIVRLQFTYIMQNLIDELYKLQAGVVAQVGSDINKQNEIRKTLRSALEGHTKFCKESILAIEDKIDAFLVKE